MYLRIQPSCLYFWGIPSCPIHPLGGWVVQSLITQPHQVPRRALAQSVRNAASHSAFPSTPQSSASSPHPFRGFSLRGFWSIIVGFQFYNVGRQRTVALVSPTRPRGSLLTIIMPEQVLPLGAYNRPCESSNENCDPPPPPPPGPLLQRPNVSMVRESYSM